MSTRPTAPATACWIIPVLAALRANIRVLFRSRVDPLVATTRLLAARNSVPAPEVLLRTSTVRT